jgi:hypothetical protein
MLSRLCQLESAKDGIADSVHVLFPEGRIDGQAQNATRDTLGDRERTPVPDSLVELLLMNGRPKITPGLNILLAQHIP